MNRRRPILAALLLAIMTALPAAAQQDAVAPGPAAGEFCSACFAYLEFSSWLEPESYATRGDTSTSLPAADEGKGDPKEQATGVVADSKE